MSLEGWIGPQSKVDLDLYKSRDIRKWDIPERYKEQGTFKVPEIPKRFTQFNLSKYFVMILILVLILVLMINMLF